MTEKTANKKRNLVKCLLQECTQAQIINFTHIFGSIETLEEKRLPAAVRLCLRTVENNFNGK